ncbi:hypothetical protein BKA65DRAFT_565066 [Rhexocercosporidium sp. MPI-PUGE-AT-0058]|nr:hypothetical protein BKA65DRAFT_565066 [Rhexocercosporidium sp. MPI-PUGE-AT-0058]
MLRLSDEILLQILKYLYYLDPDFVPCGQKEDLLATRAVCRRLAEIGASLAFEHVTIVHGERNYTSFLQMSRTPYLCQSVRRLTFTFESFEVDPTPEKFEDCRGIRLEQYSPEEFNELYENFCYGCEHQRQIEKSNLDIASLAGAMPQYRRLRSVRILEDLGSQVEHSGGRGYTGTGPRLFRAITSALYISGLAIEELHLGSLGLDPPALIGIIQELSSLALVPYLRVFGRLRRLVMILPWVVEGGPVNYYGVAELIQSAVSTTELVLRSDGLGYGLPADFFKSLSPHLQILRLDLLQIENPLHLINVFHKHAHNLKVVELYSIDLESPDGEDLEGSWELVFVEMRSCLNLESIHLSDLMLEGYGILMVEKYRAIGYPAIEDFIQRKTDDNPLEIASRISKLGIIILETCQELTHNTYLGSTNEERNLRK